MSNLSQEMFDRVVTALAAQGGPSRDENNYCQYRGPHGRKCAAGIEITDEEYSVEYEGRRFGISEYHKQDFPARLADFAYLLSSLQYAHDHALYEGSNGTATWAAPWELPAKAGLREGIAILLAGVARDHNLNPAAVEAAFPRPAAR